MPCVLTCLRGTWICWHQESFAALLPTSSSARSVASSACHRWRHLLLADSMELPWSCFLVRALPVTVRSVALWRRSSDRCGSRRDVQSCVCTCTCPPSHAHPLLVEAPGTWRRVLPLRPVLSSSWRCSPSRPAECRRVPSGAAEERRSLGQAAGCVVFTASPPGSALGRTCAVGSGWGLRCAFQNLWPEVADVTNYYDSNVWWKKWIKGSLARGLFIYLRNGLIFHSGLPSCSNNLTSVAFYWGLSTCVKFSASSQHISVIYPYFFPFREL